MSTQRPQRGQIYGGKSLKGKLIRSAMGSAGIRAVNALLSLAVAVLFARSLGADGYGVCACAFSLVSLPAMPAQLGLPQLLVREIAKYQYQHEWGLLQGLLRRANQIALGLFVALALIAAGTAWLPFSRDESLRPETFLCSFPLIPLIALGNIRGAALRGLKRVMQGQLLEFVMQPGLLLLLASIALSLGALTPAKAMALSAIAASLAFGAVLLRRSVPTETTAATPNYDTRAWLHIKTPCSTAVVRGDRSVAPQLWHDRKPPFLIALFFLHTSASAAPNFSFETETVRLLINHQAQAVSLKDIATKKEWLATKSSPLFAVKNDGKWHPAKSMRKEGSRYVVDFSVPGVSATYAVTAAKDYIVFELADLKGEHIEAIRLLQLRTKSLEIAGHILAVRWNKEFAVVPLALSPRVHASLVGKNAIEATVYPEFGMLGEKVALVAAPTERLMEAIQVVETDLDLPSPMIDGQWAKKSDAIRTSYLFIDLTVWNVDEVIRYAKLGGFKYILIYANTWSSSWGSYPINLKGYPQGEKSLRKVVDKVHAAGLRIGIHTLTSLVSKSDPLVQPVPDPGLLKDAMATLALDIDEKSTEIAITTPLQSIPNRPSFFGEDKAGLDIQIGDEIIQCRDLGRSDPRQLKQCKRGATSTRASSHQQGTKIQHLAESHGSYVADLRTSLKNKISERIAELINRVEFDMVYFDGGEVNSANGPGWYWVGRQQDDTLRRVERNLLVQGSGWTQWTWHWFARGTCDDYAEIATTPFLDHHKIARWQNNRNNFMPAELGWWAILDEAPEHRSTSPEEVEHLAIRMIALDTPISVETTVARLKANSRAEEILKELAKMEQLRINLHVSPETRRKLRGGSWSWNDETRTFRPIRAMSFFTTVPGQVEIQNPWKAQPLRVRLRVMPSLSAPGAADNKMLFSPMRPLTLIPPRPQAEMPGALIRRIELGQVPDGGAPVDLSAHRAIAVRLLTSGKMPPPQQPRPVLNLQLESDRKAYRDYYVNLDFVGTRTLIIPESNAERMYPTLKPNPKNYSAKRAFRSFDYGKVAALNLRWMRLPETWTPKVQLKAVEALAEGESLIANPRFLIREVLTEIPFMLRSGDYVTLSATDIIKMFNRHGNLLHRYTAKPLVPKLNSGHNTLVLAGEGQAAVEVTVTIVGPVVPP